MGDETDNTDSIEKRVETIEDDIEEMSFDKIESRIDVIEIEQEQLREDLDGIVESLRAKREETPQIESVKELNDRLAEIEENISSLRESLEEVIEGRE